MGAIHVETRTPAPASNAENALLSTWILRNAPSDPERIVVLECSTTQLRQRVALMAGKQTVRPTGTGGVLTNDRWNIRFAVGSSALASSLKPT